MVSLLNEKTPVTAEYVPWQGEYVVPSGCQVLVNASSIGLFPNVDAVPPVAKTSIHPDLLVCDVIPNPPQTKFLRIAASQGARTLDGLGMLVYQGAIAFEMWTGTEAPVAVMRDALTEVFGA